MRPVSPGPFGAQLKALRAAAGFTQEELATIAGLSVHGVSALERGERRRPHVETVRAICAALDLTGAARDALLRTARAPVETAVDELGGFSLPLPLTTLLGREAELQTLGQWLTDPVARLITLTGPGGAGKTRLALEIAHTIAAERDRRVAFVSLAAVRDPRFVASVIAEGLGLSDVIAVDLPLRVRGTFGDRSLLLVLDNFEHLLDAAPLVGDLLTSVASLRVLVTSRAPLRVRGEREYAVGPLQLREGAETLAPADLARAPAVRLFLERVRDVQPDFRLTDRNGPTVVATCRRLDALPLALELAAPWLKVLTIEDLLRRLERDVLLSSIGARDLPERQQTMNETVAWSYHLLSEHEQYAFRRFGALPGRFSIAAAAAVLGTGGRSAAAADALGASASLIDKSLLLRAESSVAVRPMYQMLETVRGYAALELAAAGERDDAMEGLAGYCVAEGARAATGLMGPAQVEWLSRVRDDLESYRVTLAWLIERGRAAEASDIALGLKYFWLIRGHAAEGLQWYERILQLPALPAAAEAKALLGAATMGWTQGGLERARTALERARALAHSVDATETIAHVEHVSGHVEHALGNEDAARERFVRSLECFRELAMPSGIGNALSGMAVLELATDNPDRAERLLDEATAVLQGAGPWFMTWSLYVRAIREVRCGNPDRAIALMRDSLTRIRLLHDKFALVYALVPLAAAAVLKRDDAWVARIHGTRDAITERTGVTVSDKSVQDLRQQAEQETRTRLGPDRWAVAYMAGRTSSIDALLKDIDRVLRRGRLPVNAPHTDESVKRAVSTG
jgi:predicted ATPase/transcriptional regulator with XRE-family HTH domain/nucleotide-binding universal stress UspA family protein